MPRRAKCECWARGCGGRGSLVSWATPDSSELCGRDQEAMHLPGTGPNALVPRPRPTGGGRSSLCTVGSSMGWWSWRRSVPSAMTRRWTTMRWDPALFRGLTSIQVTLLPVSQNSQDWQSLPLWSATPREHCHLCRPPPPLLSHWL